MAADDSSPTQLFEIHFLGGLADTEAIPLDDLIESLRGFERFFEITDSMFIQGRLTARALPAESRLQIRVRRIAPGGSIIAELQFVNLDQAFGLALGFGVGLASTAAWDGIKAASKKLWAWRKAVLETQAKRTKIPWSIEEAVAGLEALATSAGLAPSDDEEDPAEIVTSINSALGDAVGPIDVSVDKISLRTQETEGEILLGHAEKLIIQSQPTIGYEPVQTGEWKEAEIAFVRIHVQTGHALVKFRHPEGDDPKGVKPCSIVDPRLKKANDPFTCALSSRNFIRAWVRKAVLNEETGAFRWEVSLTAPRPDVGLFSETPVQGHRQSPDQPLGKKRPKRRS